MKPDKTIVVTVRSVYGNPTIYPVNAAAKQLAAIAGQRTLTRSIIGRIKGLGYDVIVDGSEADKTSVDGIKAITGAAP